MKKRKSQSTVRFNKEYIIYLTEDLHAHVDPDSQGGNSQGPAQDALPLSGGGLELSEGLAEGGAVQGFLLLQGQLAPVSLFLLTEDLEHESSMCNNTREFLRILKSRMRKF